MSDRLTERGRVVHTIRAFFEARGFLEVDTPAMVPSPGMDLHLDAYRVSDHWLITSPEYQMKRLLARGHERIYQICHCFRRGEKGAQHNPEFTMLEWYRAPACVDDVMRDTEQLVATVAGGRVGLPPFSRLAVCEAFARFAGVSEGDVLEWAAHDHDRYFHAWVERVEPRIAEMDRPVFVVDFPASQASLARLKPSDPRLAERFELYVPLSGTALELCNGFGELTDPVEQSARFERDQRERAARGLPVYPVDEKLLAALGSLPPCAGNALGVDRLVALACGTTDIRDVLAFSIEDV